MKLKFLATFVQDADEPMRYDWTPINFAIEPHHFEQIDELLENWEFDKPLSEDRIAEVVFVQTNIGNPRNPEPEWDALSIEFEPR